MLESVVTARQIRKMYGAFTAVADISFAIQRGECFGILGPNGAGKTTTIRMIYGFSPLTAGSLHVFGLDVTRCAREIKARIGVCQQDNTLDPDLSILQNLTVFARYFGIPAGRAKKKAAELLSFMALDHRGHARALELSGGMVRRIVLARALINDPEMLILDEPTTGLDPQSRHQVWERLDSLRRQGMSILLTTHYMDEASRLCDRIIIMDRGRILVEGRPATLIREHIGKDVLEITAPTEELRDHIRRQRLAFEDLETRLFVYGGHDDRLYHEINDRFCPEGCIMRTATLEDVFLKLTGRGLRE